ncbi:MAG: alpha/beta fold hydrolase [Gammaproteobacteria bacterium]|nr:alpha/beta fold hydrolase [Gammaproteobacteria bacterium]
MRLFHQRFLVVILPRILLFVLAVSVQPAFAAPTIEDFVKEPDILDVKLSPDGKHLAMIINEPGRRMIVVRNIEMPDMPIVGAIAEERVKPEWLTWANNDRLLISLAVPWDMFLKKLQRSVYFEADRDIEFFRTISVNKDLSDMTVLMEDERQLRNNFSLSRIANYLPNDADHVLMAAYRDEKRNLYKVNIHSGEVAFVSKGSSRTFRFLNDDEGKPLYRFDYRRRAKTIEIHKFETDGKWELVDEIRLSNDDEDNFNSRELIALDVNSIVYRKRNDKTGYYELVRLDRTTGERSVIAAVDGQDIYSALFHNRSEQLLGYRIEKDYVRDVFFDAAVQERYDQIAANFKNQNFDVSHLASDATTALIGAHGADTPYTYYLWNFASQKLTFLAHEDQRLTAETLSTPAMTSYLARDGTSLRAYILLPKSFEQGKALPTIILPHGGPQGRHRQDYNHFAQFLSTRGYIVVMPNFRGSVGYGREFETAGYKEWGGVMQDDVTDAAKFMISKGYADPDRVCIVGISYGGYAALMGAIKTPDLFRCAISINGVTHLAKQIEFTSEDIDDEKDREELLFDRIGHPVLDKEMLAANSPTRNADQIGIPVMIIAGTEDSIVPHGQAKLMVKAMKKADVDHRFLSLKDVGHYPFDDRGTAITVYNLIEGFLGAHLQ